MFLVVSTLSVKLNGIFYYLAADNRYFYMSVGWVIHASWGWLILSPLDHAVFVIVSSQILYHKTEALCGPSKISNV